MISLTDVTVDFGTTRALGPLSAHFEAGSLAALMGANGSGKTTLLRVIAGLQRPTGGEVRRSEEFSVAYVAQHLEQRWMPLRVDEVLRMAAYDRRPFPWPLSAEQKARIADAVRRLDVGDLAKRAFGDLSGGQRQRVVIASAVATGASCLLLDEPITGLDLPSQDRILEVVKQERDNGVVVILSTHHLEEAARCDRVLLLKGELIADGTPEQALTAEHLRSAFGARLVTRGSDALLVDDHGHGSHEH